MEIKQALEAQGWLWNPDPWGFPKTLVGLSFLEEIETGSLCQSLGSSLSQASGLGHYQALVAQVCVEVVGNFHEHKEIATTASRTRQSPEARRGPGHLLVVSSLKAT